MSRITKSLIFLSFILAFAQVALGNENVENIENIENNGTPAVNSQLAAYIQANAAALTNEPDVDVNYCLQQFGSTSFENQFGPVMGAIIEAGCMNGLEACDVNDFAGIMAQLQANGVDIATIQQIQIFIGGVIGSQIGEEACDGVAPCEWLGGKIGAVLTCLSVSKYVYEGIMTAISALQNAANQAGDLGQDAVNAITNAANSMSSGVQSAISQLSQGGDLLSALQSVTNDIGQGFTDIGDSIVDGLSTAGGAITGAADQAGSAIQGAADQAGSAIQGVGDQIASGFCGFFGC